jgi:hypothetical protein
LYGFRNIPIHKPISYEFISVPGGTHLHDVANAIGITYKAIEELNAELIQKRVPTYVSKYPIRVPVGASHLLAQYLDKPQASGL